MTSNLLNIVTKPEYEKEIRVRLSRVWDEEISNAEMAEDTGIPLNTISKYKNGANVSQFTTLWRMCKYLSKRTGQKVYMEDVLEILSYEGLASPNNEDGAK